MDLTAGKELQNGKYLINHVLHQGRFGITLQGTLTQSQRPVILKTLNPHLQASAQFLQLKQQFNEQVHYFKRCQHPGLEQLLDTFEADDLPFAVVDYTVGQSLAELIKTSGVLPEEAAIRYIQQVGSALTVLHQQGLIHRNVSPSAIICPGSSEITVLVNVELVPPFAEPGQTMTPMAGAYAAIEQYHTHHSLSPATDIYSLAGTLYFLLTGHAPIAAPLRHQSPLIAPRQLRPYLSTTVETAIIQGLELNPKKRPAELAAWLSLLTMSEASPMAPAISMAAHSNSQVDCNPQRLPVANGRVAYSPQPDQVKVSDFSSQPQYPAPMLSSSPSKRFSRALITTIATAGAIGVGTGLALRFAVTTTGPGTSIFHSEQAFPPLDNWPGEVVPTNPPSAYSAPPAPVVRQESPSVERVNSAPVMRPRSAEPSAEVAPTPSPTSASSPNPVEPAIPSAPPTVPNKIAPEPVYAPPSAPPMLEPEPPPPPQNVPPQPIPN